MVAVISHCRYGLSLAYAVECVNLSYSPGSSDIAVSERTSPSAESRFCVAFGGVSSGRWSSSEVSSGIAGEYGASLGEVMDFCSSPVTARLTDAWAAVVASFTVAPSASAYSKVTAAAT